MEIPLELWESLDKIPKGSIQAWKRMVKDYNQLQQERRRHDARVMGNASTFRNVGFSTNYEMELRRQEVELGREIAREFKYDQLERMRERRDKRNAPPPDTFKDDLLKMLLTAFLKGNQGGSGTNMFLRGIQTASNFIPQQMGDEAQIALKKLDIDVEKMKMDSDASTAKMNIVGNIANQVLTALPIVLGKKTPNNQTQNDVTTTKCPTCKKPFPVPHPVPSRIQCPNPNCKAILTREAETPHTHTHEHEGEETIGEQRND